MILGKMGDATMMRIAGAVTSADEITVMELQAISTELQSTVVRRSPDSAEGAIGDHMVRAERADILLNDELTASW